MSKCINLQIGERQLSVETSLFINGSFLRGNGDRLKLINPVTEELITEVDSANEADVESAVRAARDCFENHWGTNVPGTERSKLLNKLADQIESIKEDLALIESYNAGKPIEWCKFDIDDSVGCLRYYAGAADKIQGSTIEVDDPSKYAITRKEPIGVCAQIVPWNYPIMMLAWKIAPALAAGCTIIFKPSEVTPLSALKIASLFPKVGYPNGVFNVLNGTGPTVGAQLARHSDIDKLAFTGSTQIGREIIKMAAESNLKRVSLELGGKSANIVFEKANLEEAAKWAAFGIFENAGQSCTAGSRIMVQESVHDEFVKLFIKAVEAFKVGDPLDSKTFQGPQINKTQFEKILNYISIGKNEGAQLKLGGNRIGSQGFFISPTVFTQVKNEMRIGKEEIFGPVASILKFKDESEAIKIANDTTYGLASAVHSQDFNQIQRVTRKIKSGTVWVNQYVILNNQVPFGGYKQSGWGRELGLDVLDTYLITKSVHYYYGDQLEWPIST